MKTLILAHEAIIKITLVLTISNCSIFQFLEYYELKIDIGRLAVI